MTGEKISQKFAGQRNEIQYRSYNEITDNVSARETLSPTTTPSSGDARLAVESKKDRCCTGAYLSKNPSYGQDNRLVSFTQPKTGNGPLFFLVSPRSAPIGRI